MVRKFEFYFVAVLAILSGIVMIYISVMGPLLADKIQYKTSLSAIYQLQGQDIANIVFLAPLYIIAGVLMFCKKEIYKYLLILPPLSVIYYALSVAVGLEWSNQAYTGNSHEYFYYFLFLIVSSLVIMLYSLSLFSDNNLIQFKKKGLIIYTIIFAIFLLMFMRMWVVDINDVIKSGSSPAYDENPTVFWVIKSFDLGFVIPLGFISLYLLWTRADQAAGILFLFYGFFISMGVAVNAMGISMLINDDPQFDSSGLVIFICLLLIAAFGYLVILRKYLDSNKS